MYVTHPWAYFPSSISRQLEEQWRRQKVNVGSISPRQELSEDVSFGSGTGSLLLVGYSTVANRPRGVSMIYNVYGTSTRMYVPGILLLLLYAVYTSDDSVRTRRALFSGPASVVRRAGPRRAAGGEKDAIYARMYARKPSRNEVR